MAEHRYRLIDTAGSELEIVTFDRDDIAEDEVIQLPDGSSVLVVEIYDDEEWGQEGGVVATLVIDEAPA